MDFFTVPTLTFSVLYCFFVTGHDRRKILRFNVTRNPDAFWIVRQMREAWPYVPAHRFPFPRLGGLHHRYAVAAWAPTTLSIGINSYCPNQNRAGDAFVASRACGLA